MSKIKVESKCAIYDGMSITFKAPCDSAAVDGMNVYYQGKKQTFAFRDARGNNLSGLGQLFSEGAYVKAILDTNNHYAFLQNADSNVGNEYVWEKVKTVSRQHIEYIQYSNPYIDSLMLWGYEGNEPPTSQTLQYASAIDNNKNLIDPQTVTYSRTNYSHLSSTLANKFFLKKEYESTDTTLYYADGTPTIEVNDYSDPGADWYECNINIGNATSIVKSIGAVYTFTAYEHYEYVSSPNPSAYPKSDGFTYLPMGQLGQKTRTVTGSYVGTGTREFELTFDDIPCLMLVLSEWYASAIILPKNGTALNLKYTNSNAQIKPTTQGQTLKIYTYEEDQGVNKAGETFNYIAFID